MYPLASHYPLESRRGVFEAVLVLFSPCFSKQRACLSAFPHLADVCFDSSYVCCSAYDGDWRETFLDGNRGNRSAVLDWKMENMGPVRGSGDVNAQELGGDDEVRVKGELNSLRRTVQHYA